MIATTASQPIGVLVMAYGGPNSLEDIPGFLADIRAGRTTSREVVAEITDNYRQIGGSSPLLRRTREQIDALQQALDQRFPGRFLCYCGMRHWAPWIEDAVTRLLDDGIDRAIGIVLAPHYSSLSIAQYQNRAREAFRLYHGEPKLRFVSSYHDHPRLIEAFAQRLQSALSSLPADERDEIHVVMSAHSLPQRIVREGDPYPDQLQASAERIAAATGLDRQDWSWCYQSAGRSPEPWLGPSLEEHLTQLAARGVRHIISLPIGFVSDHVEIQYDIDIKAQQLARELGLRLSRPAALNADQTFIAALADVVTEIADDWVRPL